MARTKNSEIYNHEGYTDPTAYFGMMENQTRGGVEHSQITRDIRRGEIYYIAPDASSESPLEVKSRPGIIVSCDQSNRVTTSVEVVYLTTKERKSLPCDVKVCGTGTPSTALCGKVHFVTMDRLRNYAGATTEAEQKEIDRALMYGLGITIPEAPKAPAPKSQEIAPEPQPTAGTTKLAAELAKATVERDLYKKLYDQLFSEIMTRTYKRE